MPHHEHHFRNRSRARDHLTETIVSLESAVDAMTGDDWIDATALLHDISLDIGPRLARLRTAASERFDAYSRLEDFAVVSLAHAGGRGFTPAGIGDRHTGTTEDDVRRRAALARRLGLELRPREPRAPRAPRLQEAPPALVGSGHRSVSLLAAVGASGATRENERRARRWSIPDLRRARPHGRGSRRSVGVSGSTGVRWWRGRGGSEVTTSGSCRVLSSWSKAATSARGASESMGLENTRPASLAHTGQAIDAGAVPIGNITSNAPSRSHRYS
ncbi:MAG TPA: hypothetical protein VN213_03350 [Solirubrobacteraceae bacterium]|nr:hypothetical protein [Solirubrobacteraceae bacterium]